MNPVKVVAAFVKNRAELLEPDVTGEFIVPPFFNGLMLQDDRKAVRVVGGRGCGKTMFLRFLSYPTQLSERGGEVSADVFGAGIGLYWKPDTGFCDLMKPQWLGDDDADRAFIHHVAIVVLGEFTAFVDRLASIKVGGRTIDLRRKRLPEDVRVVLPPAVIDYDTLAKFVRLERMRLSHWVQNPQLQRPIFLRLNDLLQTLIEDVASQDPALGALFIRLFVDEFENIKPHQRKIVCDLVKQPTSRYSANFAMRRDSVDDFETSAGEQVVETHDFRTIDLEHLFSNEDTFKQMAAELFLLKLEQSQIQINVPAFSGTDLHDPTKLPRRREESYTRDIKEAAKKALPGLSSTEIAERVFTDEPLRRRLALLIKKGLDLHSANSRFGVEQFLRPDKPAASVVAAFVLNRPGSSPADLLKSLDEFTSAQGRANPFFDWINNNLHGALFWLYLGLPLRPNPLYAGFETYCTITRPNLRFFLEYCHCALRDALLDTSSKAPSPLVISVEVQAEAAREASQRLLEQVSKLGLKGHELQRMIKRLGRLFALAHTRESQSEPEINHFSIDEADREQLVEGTRNLLREARIWTVLYQEGETKSKTDATTVQYDYIPNTIFSPAFAVSYRKRRKLVLKASEINAICCGTDRDFDAVLQAYQDKWAGVKQTGSRALFDD